MSLVLYARDLRSTDATDLFQESRDVRSSICFVILRYSRRVWNTVINGVASSALKKIKFAKINLEEEGRD